MVSVTRILELALPPFVVQAARRLSPVPDAAPEWEFMPEGWAARSDITGWTDPSIALAESAKWDAFKRLVNGVGPLGIAHEAPDPRNDSLEAHNIVMSFGYVIARAAHSCDRLTMLDWGGGLGHYCLLAEGLLPDVHIDYHCVDLPALIRRGQLLLPNAHFHATDTTGWVQPYDLVIASNSVQYSEDWRKTTACLAQMTRRYLYLANMFLVDRAPSFVAVQRPYRYGYHTEYLSWFFNRKEFLDHMDGLGMEMVREFLMQSPVHVHGAPAPTYFRGFLFRPVEARTDA